ncbi:MAG: class II aldolase/adducin family protein [Sphingorhabdus sp.]
MLSGSGKANNGVTRRDVALAYRLMAHYRMSDLTDGFVAARCADDAQSIIIGGYAIFPELVVPKDLHRRVLTDEPKLEKHGGVDIDAIHFSQCVLGAREDLNAVIHAHPPFISAFSALKTALLPISQSGLIFHKKLGYIEFEYDVTAPHCQEQISAAICNGAEAIILRNHGVVIPGVTVADAFIRLYRLEQACDIQLRAMASGDEFNLPDPDQAVEWGQSYWTDPGPVDNDGSREWPSIVALLARKDPEIASW